MTESRPNRSFVTTRWEVVSRVSSLDELERSEALDTLVKHYFPALVEYTKQDFRVSEEKAADWVQGFILDKILLRNLLNQANEKRGRFRSFLLACLKSYITDQIRYDHAAKRFPDGGVKSLDVNDPEVQSQNPDDAQSLFDEFFIRQVVLDALYLTRQRCLEQNNLVAWEILIARIVSPLLENTKPVSYSDLMAAQGVRSISECYNKLATAKGVFKKALREQLDLYATSSDELEEELNFFKKFF